MPYAFKAIIKEQTSGNADGVVQVISIPVQIKYAVKKENRLKKHLEVTGVQCNVSCLHSSVFATMDAVIKKIT